MTYCVAMRLDQGLVFLSDSRTNAGVDQISTFRKMTIIERPGDRLIVLMTSGNLAISQAVLQIVSNRIEVDGSSLWTVSSLHDAALIVGAAVREVRERDAQALDDAGIDFNVSFILGGQIKDERCRLFLVYSAGNFIEAHTESPYFQIGEAKYGKPVVDRMVTPDSSLDEGAKCALVSMDSTLRSNISVGLPLDLLVYETGSLCITRFVTIDHTNQYFQMIHNTWGQRLKQVFREIPDPVWSDAPIQPMPASGESPTLPVRAPIPLALATLATDVVRPYQTIAAEATHGKRRNRRATDLIG